jgi:hypothetical protein
MTGGRSAILVLLWCCWACFIWLAWFVGSVAQVGHQWCVLSVAIAGVAGGDDTLMATDSRIKGMPTPFAPEVS